MFVSRTHTCMYGQNNGQNSPTEQPLPPTQQLFMHARPSMLRGRTQALSHGKRTRLLVHHPHTLMLPVGCKPCLASTLSTTRSHS
jgi:hypothetical protein